MSHIDLPVPVLDGPHWRVNYRSATYVPQRLASLSDCLETIEKNRVLLRGWDFPHLPHRRDLQLEYGSQWLGAWSDFNGHFEYWRLYQSTQFLYLGSVREATDSQWSALLRQTLFATIAEPVDADSVPGVMGITNLEFTITEFFEFAARLAQARLYVEPTTISITLKGVKNFLLAPDDNRLFVRRFAAGDNNLAYERTFTPAELVGSAADRALECIVWYFERFGWLKPNVESIKRAQQQLLTMRF